MIAMTLAAVVQGLTGRADIAIMFRFVSETLGPKNGLLFLWILSRVRT
jgi:hypothetical protein